MRHKLEAVNEYEIASQHDGHIFLHVIWYCVYCHFFKLTPCLFLYDIFLITSPICCIIASQVVKDHTYLIGELEIRAASFMSRPAVFSCRVAMITHTLVIFRVLSSTNVTTCSFLKKFFFIMGYKEIFIEFMIYYTSTTFYFIKHFIKKKIVD